MYLFILENIGTQEIVLIGLVALIFLGPRKMPEYARKIGKIMAEFRGTANEFKETWQREANLDHEVKSLSLSELEKETPVPPPAIAAATPADGPAAPMIKQIDASAFENGLPPEPVVKETAEKAETATDGNDKKNWL